MTAHSILRVFGLALAAFWLGTASAETRSVIDPVEAPAPQKPPAPVAQESAEPDAAVKQERRRAAAEQRRRADAAARARAAENEAAKLRAAEESRRAEAAARDAAAKAAARKAAAARAAAAKLAKAKAAEAARREAARQVAAREAAAKKLAEREAIAREARETAAREAAAREVAAREAAAREAREVAAREAAAREAREAAAREAAAREAREAAAREAREAAVREAAAREAAAREAAAREAAAREAAAKEAATREAAARERAARLAAAREAQTVEWRAASGLPNLKVFRDCGDCPEVVWLPRGELSPGDSGAGSGPRYALKMSYVLAVGRFKVSNAEWDACVADRGCRRRPDWPAWGRTRDPVTNVSWEDAQQYAAWLSRRTSKPYRLLTGAEWEYAARTGSEVYDMYGNVSEWVENCYQYRDPRNGKGGWTLECTNQTLRGGTARTARSYAPVNHHDDRIGFRVARTE